MTNIEDAHAPYALASIAWSGVKWHYPRIEKMVDELRRLRQIEAAARAAGQITKDGKFAKINGSVWHPNEDCMGAVRVHPCGSPQWADFLHIDDWDIHYNKVTSHPVSDCYSTPEAAQAAKEGKK